MRGLFVFFLLGGVSGFSSEEPKASEIASCEKYVSYYALKEVLGSMLLGDTRIHEYEFHPEKPHWKKSHSGVQGLKHEYTIRVLVRLNEKEAQENPSEAEIDHMFDLSLELKSSQDSCSLVEGSVQIQTKSSDS